MKSIKNLKREAKKGFFKKIGVFILITIISLLIIGEKNIDNTAIKVIKTIQNGIDEVKEIRNTGNTDFKQNIYDTYVDKVLSELFEGNNDGLVKAVREDKSIGKGVTVAVTNFFTKGQTQVQIFINSIIGKPTQEQLNKAVAIILAVVAILLKIFIINPLNISIARMYLESKSYKVKFGRLKYAFNKEYYLNIVKSAIVLDIYKFLWSLTLIGGIVKSYSYRMFNFIIAENPEISPLNALTLSRKMMNHHKMNAFLLDLSFLGWNILRFVTIGIAGILVDPYYNFTYVEFYSVLRKDYIEAGLQYFEKFDDDILFDDVKRESYYPIPEYLEKIKRDYENTYPDFEISKIVLFFFFFSIIGWLWEVFYFIVIKGQLVNRGFLRGPWLPIYGFGCALLILFTKSKKLRKLLNSPVWTFIFITIFCTALEYITSYVIEKQTGVRYWDYSKLFMNINGRVCLKNSIFFGIGGSLCIYIIGPAFSKHIEIIPKKIRYLLVTILVITISLDFAYSIINLHTGEGITEVREAFEGYLKDINKTEFS